MGGELKRSKSRMPRHWERERGRNEGYVVGVETAFGKALDREYHLQADRRAGKNGSHGPAAKGSIYHSRRVPPLAVISRAICYFTRSGCTAVEHSEQDYARSCTTLVSGIGLNCAQACADTNLPTHLRILNHPLANPEETRRFSKQSNAVQDFIHRHASSFDKQINPHCKCVDIPRIFCAYTVARPHCRFGKVTVLNECSHKYPPKYLSDFAKKRRTA